MTLTNNLTAQKIDTGVLIKRMLICATIGLALIAIFLATVKHSDASWGRYWMIKPLIMVPIAGAAGGAWYYFISRMFDHGGWSRIIVNIIGLISIIIALWLGTILGLNGTLWN